MDQLRRETQPPAGRAPAPVPQYWNPSADGGAGGYERVEGYGGAMRVTMIDMRGLASERPPASAANKGKIYWSIDTGDISVSTGTAWRSLGVA